ncbi:hypothetical protein Cgig2_000114 [Carnegiea gigantea]|uniref:COX assembly mitochondrial protein n=1 Tax=Carnegiea gigantea TaxID=171969 RepID=A0A9Q1KZ36_9CARY|nr:hypothetical protein Cgig2_000114 [Carnegiea gigantea]
MEKETKMAVPKGECERLHKALCECHRRIPAGAARKSACRHLNRALADCLVSVICPSELEAVQSLCSSAGTALKRSQCQQARLSLSICLSSHQDKLMEIGRVGVGSSIRNFRFRDCFRNFGDLLGSENKGPSWVHMVTNAFQVPRGFKMLINTSRERSTDTRIQMTKGTKQYHDSERRLCLRIKRTAQ